MCIRWILRDSNTNSIRSPAQYLFTFDCLFSQNRGELNVIAFAVAKLLQFRTKHRLQRVRKREIISRNLMLSFIRLPIHSLENVCKYTNGCQILCSTFAPFRLADIFFSILPLSSHNVSTNMHHPSTSYNVRQQHQHQIKSHFLCFFFAYLDFFLLK